MTWLDRVRNEDARQALRQDAVLCRCGEGKAKVWKEKLEQMDDDRLVKRVYEEDVPGKRPRGRPRKGWHENFKHSSCNANATLNMVIE